MEHMDSKKKRALRIGSEGGECDAELLVGIVADLVGQIGGASVESAEFIDGHLGIGADADDSSREILAGQPGFIVDR